MLREVLPPAHIQQVAGELVKALQLCSEEAGQREGRKRWLPACLGPKLRAGGAAADAADSTLITSMQFPFKASNHEIPVPRSPMRLFFQHSQRAYQR